MRPRLITAENGLPGLGFDGVRGASMRPRLITAENGLAAIGKKVWGGMLQ